MGTVGYMSPEQVRGDPTDRRMDIFAFGAILYEMLTGKRAFQKPTSAETMSAILNEEPLALSQAASNVPMAMQRVVYRCLEKNPEQRFQSASDLAFALDALSESGNSANVTIVEPISRRFSPTITVALIFVALALAAVAMLWMRRPRSSADRSAWVQITNFPDSALQPALSPDGRMLTFVRGTSTFVASGESTLSSCRQDSRFSLPTTICPKMSPVFSSDGSRIAYTALSGSSWDTWAVPVLGGQPERWLPNASGLVWVGSDHVMFSEVKSGEHMAIVTSAESRGEARDIYVPPTQRGMAHALIFRPMALGPPGRDGQWLPCRALPFSGGNPGHRVGLPSAPCYAAAWSPDGKWIYLSLHGKDNFHIWQQRFPGGQLEQITSGPAEEEGITLAPDGHSLITSIGLRQRTVSFHQANEDHRISLEGYAYRPALSPHGKKLYYRVLKGGTSPMLGASELWVADIASGRNEPFSRNCRD